MSFSVLEALLQAIGITYHLKEKEKREGEDNKAEPENEHHTSKYEHSNLIVRRGQPFEIEVTFNRPYEDTRDEVILQFAFGKRSV